MLRMPAFQYHHPTSPAEAVALWHEHPDSMYVAGGTDLLPNLKHHLFSPAHLIGLSGLPKDPPAEKDGVIVVDGGMSLHNLSEHPLIQERLAPLAQAAGLVAGPQIRRMGTLGGNILLDTRCLFYNQSKFWRDALGFCLKKEGDWCHVVGGPKTCVAAQSSDTVPVLLALDASIVLQGREKERVLNLRDLFQFNGMDHLAIEPGELLTQVHIPMPGPGFSGIYLKLRTRDSIDFPQLGLAAVSTWEGAILTGLEIVVGAVNPKPKGIRGLDVFLGKELDEEAVSAIGQLVMKQTRPNTAISGDPQWRRAMAGIYTSRALKALRPQG
jgi:4-hydroxybenzoyl-CoA reductase beta subunit